MLITEEETLERLADLCDEAVARATAAGATSQDVIAWLMREVGALRYVWDRRAPDEDWRTG